MNRLVSRLCLSLAVLALAVPATRASAQSADFAPPAARRLGLLLRMGLDFGGDKVQELVYEDGDKVAVKAGGLVHLAGGLLYRADAWALESTIGYKVDDASASNGSVTFSRVPVELIGAFKTGNHRIGAGPTLHLSPKYTCDLGYAACLGEEEVEFKNSAGGIIQYVYGAPLGDHGFEFGARFTIIKYQTKDEVTEFTGNSFGVFFGGWI